MDLEEEIENLEKQLEEFKKRQSFIVGNDGDDLIIREEIVKLEDEIKEKRNLYYMDLDDEELEATKEALQEVKLDKEGKIKLNNWEDFKQELKTADELFKQLDYMKLLDNNYMIKYFNEYNEVVIRFNKITEQVISYVRNSNDKLYSRYLKVEELQAINKKIEELGWI